MHLTSGPNQSINQGIQTWKKLGNDQLIIRFWLCIRSIIFGRKALLFKQKCFCTGSPDFIQNKHSSSLCKKKFFPAK